MSGFKMLGVKLEVFRFACCGFWVESCALQGVDWSFGLGETLGTNPPSL